MESKEEEMKEKEKEKENLFSFSFPEWDGSRKRMFLPNDGFFNAGNVERELLAKQVLMELTEKEKDQILKMEEDLCWETVCPISGCKAKLKGPEDLESHILGRHMASCSICSRVFPTTRLLNIHISEAHDSFFQAKAARGHPVYVCLVEGCGNRFQTDSARCQHLVDMHKFPKSFRFHTKRHLSKKQRQKIHNRRTTKQNLADKVPIEQAISTDGGGVKKGDSHEVKESNADMEIDSITTAVSRLSTSDELPTNVSFGRRHNRGFAFAPNKPKGRGHLQKQVIP